MTDGHAEETRRTFYTKAIFAMWALIGAALGVPGLAYLSFPPEARKENQWVDAGDIGELAPGQPAEMVFRRNRTDGWKVVSEKSSAWVVKRPDNTVAAFGPQCTHLGCAYHWASASGDFICPCHNSIFSIDGSVVAGPAQRPLDRYNIKVDGTRLLIGELQTPQGA